MEWGEQNGLEVVGSNGLYLQRQLASNRRQSGPDTAAAVEETCVCLCARVRYLCNHSGHDHRDLWWAKSKQKKKKKKLYYVVSISN